MMLQYAITQQLACPGGLDSSVSSSRHDIAMLGNGWCSIVGHGGDSRHRFGRKYTQGMKIHPF